MSTGFTISDLHIVVYMVAAYLAVALNGFLVYLLWTTKSVSTKRIYRLLLVIFAISNCLLAAFYALIVPVPMSVPYGFVLFGIYSSGFGGPTAFGSYILFSVLLILPYFFLSYEFIHRLFAQMGKGHWSRRSSHKTILAVSTLVFFVFISVESVLLAKIAFSDPVLVHNRSKQVHDFAESIGVVLTKKTIPYLPMVFAAQEGASAHFLYANILPCACAVFVLCIPITVIVVCWILITRKLSDPLVPNQIRHRQSRLFRSLKSQVLMLLIFSFIPLTLMLIFLLLVPSATIITSLLMLLSSFFPCFHPLILLYLHPDLRKRSKIILKLSTKKAHTSITPTEPTRTPSVATITLKEDTNSDVGLQRDTETLPKSQKSSSI